MRDSRRRPIGVVFALVSSSIFGETLRVSDSVADGQSLLANTYGDLLYSGANGSACQGKNCSQARPSPATSYQRNSKRAIARKTKYPTTSASVFFARSRQRR